MAATARTLVRDLGTAWRQYRHARRRAQPPPDPGRDALEAGFAAPLAAVGNAVRHAACLQVEASRPPWTATGLMLEPGQQVSAFATGRIWRSRARDLWIGPQLGLWYRIGEIGTVFNGTRATHSFTAGTAGELYLATQFPGQFADPSGRVQPSLHAYDGADGGFAVQLVLWRGDEQLAAMAEAGDPFGLVSMELDRQARPAAPPPGWQFLWFLGVSEIFSAGAHRGAHCIHCRTRGNVGILQKEVALPLAPGTTLSWDWVVDALPSRLREDTSASHDYLSIAVEFENGRDITYHWSWELPAGYGYWCPLPTWRDREFHVVIRSGRAGLGAWHAEQRDLHADYRQYMGTPPARIVRVWLIASSRWQRHAGEMSLANVRLEGSGRVVEVI